METSLKAKVRWFRLQNLAFACVGKVCLQQAWCTRGNMCTWKHAHVETRVHMYGIRVHTVPVLAPIFEQWKPSYGKGQKSAGNLQSAQLSISCIYMYIYILYIYMCMWYTIAKYIMYV